MWHSGAAGAGAMTCHPRHPQLPVPQQLLALMSTLHAPQAFQLILLGKGYCHLDAQHHILESNKVLDLSPFSPALLH